METLTLNVPPTLDDAAISAELAGEFLTSNQVVADTVYAVTLVLEELLTNVVKYGGTPADALDMKVHIALSTDEIHVRTEDRGQEFDPFSAAPPDLDMPIEDRPIGGLGVHFIRQMSSRYNYVRENGVNIINVYFKLLTSQAVS
jgi:anti-sigma regulatory factor (Ser/Thr protein kinase)